MKYLTARLGPGYLFSGSLENFNWITWINPQSKVLALVFGGRNGLGLNPWPTWDWPRSVQMVDVFSSWGRNLTCVSHSSPHFSPHWTTRLACSSLAFCSICRCISQTPGTRATSRSIQTNSTTDLVKVIRSVILSTQAVGLTLKSILNIRYSRISCGTNISPAFVCYR